MIKILLLISWLLINIVLKLQSRYSFIIVLLLLLASLFSVSIGRIGFALKIVTFLFGVLVVGVYQYLLETKHEQK
jgi:hypothetical protein